jgi:hypothetical protein
MKRSALSVFIRGKKILTVLVLVMAAAVPALFAPPSAGATVTVSGHVKLGNGGIPDPSQVQIRFSLLGCSVAGMNTPHVIGVADFISGEFTLTPQPDGSWSGTTYGYDVITCDTTGNTKWRISYIYKNGLTTYNDYCIPDGGTWVKEQNTPCSLAATAYTPGAVVINPPGNATQTIGGPIADPSGFTGPLTGNVIGNASTATALDHNPADCGANQYAQGIDATGAASGCTQPSFPNVSGAASKAQVPATTVYTDPAGAQNIVQPGGTRFSVTGGGTDLGGAPSAPAQRGTSLPATCSMGDEYFKTDVAAGLNKYGCTSTNVWSLLGGAGSLVSVFGRTGTVVATANDYNFNQLAGQATQAQLPSMTQNVLQKGNSAGGTTDSGALDNGVYIGAYNFNFTNPSDLNTFFLRDDFITTSTSNFGALNWKVNNQNGGTIAITTVPYDGSEPGIISLITDAGGATHGGEIFLDNQTSAALVQPSTVIFDAQFRFKLAQTTATRFNVGFHDATGIARPNSIYVRYDTTAGTADTNFMYIVGANAAVSSGIPADTQWHTLRIRATTASVIKFSFDGGTETSFSSGIPANSLYPFFLILSDGAVAKQINVGAFTLAMYGFGRSLDQLPFGAFNAFGDSVTQGFNAGTPSIGGFAPTTSQYFGYRLNNFAVSGTRIGSWAYYQYGSTVSISSSTTQLSIFGVNDEGPVGGVQGNLDAWKLAARANLLYGSIADADKKKASTWSLSGSWASVSTGFANYDTWGGKQTSSATASASTTVSGTVAYLVLLNRDTGDVNYGVTIDSVSQGTFSNAGNSILENGFGGLNVYPVALRFTGLAAGSHTIAVTYNSGTTPLVLLWAGGNAAPSGKPRYLAGNCIPQQNNTNAAFITSLNSTLSTTVSELNGDGLKTYFWDANSTLPTANTFLWSDSLHPTNVGHWTLAQSLISFAKANP